MSTLNTALYAGSASADLARLSQAAQLRGQEDVVAQQLRGAFDAAPGSTITARYQYRVGQDGQLYPTETHITTDAENVDSATDEQSRGKRGNFLRQQDGRRQSFGDFTKPRPLLSPTDELELFSTLQHGLSSIGTGEASVAQTVASATIQGEAVAEDGSAVDVQILPPQNQSVELEQVGGQVLTLASRAQQSVANLYARNNDVVYNESPLSQLAA